MGVANAVQHSDGLDAPQNLFVHHPHGRNEGIIDEEFHGLRLALFFDEAEDAAFLPDGLFLAVEPADDLRNVIHLGLPLADHAAVHFGKVVVGLAFLPGSGGHEHFGYALQVLHAQRGGLHGIGIADGFGFVAGVGIHGVGGGESQPRLIVLLLGPLIEGRLLFVGGGGGGNRGVSPPGRPDIVGADARHQVFDGDMVFRLGDIIEARVVHDGRGVAHLMDPFRIADFLEGVFGTGLHVVLKADGVAHFVADYVFQQTAHQVIGQRQLLRARIERADLGEIPVAGQHHDVVIELDVRIEDLARARVGNMRAAGVLDGGGQPADYRMTHVFRAPGGVFFRRWHLLGDDRVGESRFFEGDVPILHAFDQPRDPLGGSRGVDVVDDRLDGVRNCGVGVLLFEAPAGDVLHVVGLVIVVRVVRGAGGEVAHAIVEQARHHGLLGQFHHAVMEHHGSRAAAHGAAAESAASTSGAGGSAATAGSVGVRHSHLGFQILGERMDVFDERTGGIHAGSADVLARADLGHFSAGAGAGRGDEEAGDVDYRVAVIGEGGHGEGHQNGVVIGGLNGRCDGRLGVGADAEVDILEEDAVALLLPADDEVGKLAAAVPHADRRLGYLRIPEKIFAQLAFGNLVIERVFDLVDGEEAFGGFGFFGDDLVVGLRFRVGGATPAASALRGRGRSVVLRVKCGGRAEAGQEDHGDSVHTFSWRKGDDYLIRSVDLLSGTDHGLTLETSRGATRRYLPGRSATSRLAGRLPIHLPLALLSSTSLNVSVQTGFFRVSGFPVSGSVNPGTVDTR